MDSVSVAGDDPFALIQQAKAGDADAWNRLLNPLQRPLHQFLCRFLSSTDAADVLQQTFLVVFQKIDQCRQPDRFSAWVFQTAYRQMQNHHRKLSRPIHNTQTLDFDPVSTTGSLPDHDHQQQLDDLRVAVDQLPGEIRQVVWLRLKEQMSFKEISKITGSPLGTVLGRMRQGKERLKKILSSL